MKTQKFVYAKLATLKNRELSGFLNGIVKAIDLLPEDQTIALITKNLTQYTQELSDALAMENTKTRTIEMHNIDSKLINSWNAMRIILTGLAVDSAIATKAEQILELINQIGDPRYANIKTKNSIIKNVIETLETIDNETLQQSGIQYHYNAIKDAYKQYIDAEIERMEYRNSCYQKVLNARQNVTFAYYSLANLVRTMIAYTNIKEYQTFAERVNQAVKETYKRHYNTLESNSDTEQIEQK